MERKPDREGYRDYCRRSDADKRLADRARADWCAKRDTELAQYWEMHRNEWRIDFETRESVADIVDWYQRSNQVKPDRQKMEACRAALTKVVEEWDRGRQRDDADYREFHKANDFRFATTERRQERPRETEGQAWFAAKLEVEQRHLQRVLASRKALAKKLDPITRQHGGVPGKGRSPQIMPSGLIGFQVGGHADLPVVGDLAESKQFYRLHGESNEHFRIFVPGTREAKTPEEFQAAVAAFNEKVRRILEQENERVPQLGDPGYAEWRQQMRQKNRGERER